MKAILASFALFALAPLAYPAAEPDDAAPPCADALRAEANALAADIANRLDSSVRPGAPFPGFHPPVSPDADPAQSIDSDALRAEIDKLETISDLFSPHSLSMVGRRRQFINRRTSRQHPLLSEEIVLLADTLSSLTNLSAAVEAFSVPGYRSSIPGLVSPPEDAAPRCGYFVEPRTLDIIDAATFLCQRINLAILQGNVQAALDDRTRLLFLTDLLFREPAPAVRARALSLRDPTRFVGLPAEVLDDAAREADAFADSLEARLPDLFLESFHYKLAERLESLPYLDPENARTDAQIQAFRLFSFRRLAETIAPLRAILDLPPGPERAAAIHAAARLPGPPDDSDSFFGPIAHDALSSAFCACSWIPETRNDATIARTAAALLRYHRERHALPATLDELVPDFLPSVPLAANGSPLDYAPGPIPLPEATLPPSPMPGITLPARPLPALSLPGFLLSAASPFSAPTVFFPLPGALPIDLNAFPLTITIL